MSHSRTRSLIEQVVLFLFLSLLFSAIPFVSSLLLDKSNLWLAVLTAWYAAVPPVLLLLLAWRLYRYEPSRLSFAGRLWVSAGIWFGLQALFQALSGIHVLVQLLAFPALTAGGKGFVAAALAFLGGGALLWIVGRRPNVGWTVGLPRWVPALATAGLLVISLIILPLLVLLTVRPSPALPQAGPPMPTEEEIFGYIADLYNMGTRRPGSEADRAAIRYLEEELREFGFADVRSEPFRFNYWVPEKWSLTVEPKGSAPWEVESFYVPYSGPTSDEGIIAEIADVGQGTEADFAAADVSGKIVLADLLPVDIGWDQMKLFSFMAYDPEKTASGWSHPYPIGWMFRYLEIYERAQAHGAVGIIGILHDYPDMGDFTYYAPYDGVLRPIPSLYVMENDGIRIREKVATGPVEARIVLRAQVFPQGGETATVYGVLPGRSETVLMVHSHHDAPWASGVEDSSGVGMVLALARYFAQVPQEQRPRTMVFAFTGSHMVGAPSNQAFMEAHREDLMGQMLFDICIEHIADDYLPPLPPTGKVEPRGVFIAENPVVVSLYAGVVDDYRMVRTLLFPTGTPLGVPTDAGPFARAGYRVISLISGPVWLFDDDDALERVARDQLEPLATMYVDFIRRLNRMPDPLLTFNLNVWTALVIGGILTPLAVLSAAHQQPGNDRRNILNSA